MVIDGLQWQITKAESNLMQLCKKGKLATMDINRWFQSFQFSSTLLTNAHHHLRWTGLTSNAAFCTVIWLKTLAPSGQTVFSSSLLREKSCAPFNTPRLLTVLKEKGKRNRALDTLSTKKKRENFLSCSNPYKCPTHRNSCNGTILLGQEMTGPVRRMTLRLCKMVMKCRKGASGFSIIIV